MQENRCAEEQGRPRALPGLKDACNCAIRDGYARVSIFYLVTRCLPHGRGIYMLKRCFQMSTAPNPQSLLPPLVPSMRLLAVAPRMSSLSCERALPRRSDRPGALRAPEIISQKRKLWRQKRFWRWLSFYGASPDYGEMTVLAELTPPTINTRRILESVDVVETRFFSNMHLLPWLSLVFLVGGAYASRHDFGIPSSHATVDVRVFNVGSIALTNSTHAIVLPALPGHETMHVPMFSFLVEHKKTQKRLMFDLGMRKDPLNFAPSVAAFFTGGVVLEESKDITEQLQDGGIALASIDTVIWSHSHFDHIGDMSKFPNTTGLVIGPGTDTATFPESPNAALQTSDLAGHNVTKLNFARSRLTFSGLKAIDFFNDGSFYLLDTPGHALLTSEEPQHLPGHISALARVTPTSFISLGGDAFHHAGEARPRPQFQKNFPCPAHLLEETKTSISTDYFWSPGSREGAFDMRSRAQQLFAVSDLPDSFLRRPGDVPGLPGEAGDVRCGPRFFRGCCARYQLEVVPPVLPCVPQ
ncbi:hypothetical protein DFH09DRAFT_1093716 [Mycena vulgaris]|nr:hypothetical protein DFH09DRAFT_1093716 [Mycena vulgaris]